MCPQASIARSGLVRVFGWGRRVHVLDLGRRRWGKGFQDTGLGRKPPKNTGRFGRAQLDLSDRGPPDPDTRRGDGRRCEGVMTTSSLDLYTRFFGLDWRPFSLVPDSRFLFWSRHHQRAFAMLEYGIMTRSPITLLTGEIGAGKSTLLFHLLNTVGDDLRLGLVANAHGDRGELLHWVLLALDLDPGPDESYVQLFGRLQEFLIAEYAAGRRVVLIFDEAQNLKRESLEELRMLTNINQNGDELLQIVLVGQPELRDVVRRADMRQFKQRVAASVHLPGLDAGMVKEYLDFRLRAAGALTEIFTEGAANLIFDATEGVPRLINQLADLSLVYAYTNDMRGVDRAMVQQVLDEGAFFGMREPLDEEDGPKAVEGEGEANRVLSLHASRGPEGMSEG